MPYIFIDSIKNEVFLFYFVVNIKYKILIRQLKKYYAIKYLENKNSLELLRVFNKYLTASIMSGVRRTQTFRKLLVDFPRTSITFILKHKTLYL